MTKISKQKPYLIFFRRKPPKIRGSLTIHERDWCSNWVIERQKLMWRSNWWCFTHIHTIHENNLSKIAICRMTVCKSNMSVWCPYDIRRVHYNYLPLEINTIDRPNRWSRTYRLTENRKPKANACDKCKQKQWKRMKMKPSSSVKLMLIIAN